MHVLCEEDKQRGGLDGGKTLVKKPTLQKDLSNPRANHSSDTTPSPVDSIVSKEEETKEEGVLKQMTKRECKYDFSVNPDDTDDKQSDKEDDDYFSHIEDTKENLNNQDKGKAKLNNDKGWADRSKEIENETEGVQVKFFEQQRIWQKQEEDNWLEKDLERQLKERDQNQGDLTNISGGIEYKEEDKKHVRTVKIDNVEDIKPTIGDMRIIWEKKFVQLMNQIENLESISISNRTKQEEYALKKMRKKYHKKKRNYPHLARAHLSESVKKIGKEELYHPNFKIEESKNVLGSPSFFFGSGTISSPVVKFYFTAPCPQLGISAGCEPLLGGRPAFLASQLAFTCRLCQLEVTSGLELVEHWREELERQGEQLAGELLDIPHAEVRPAEVSTNENMEVKIEGPGGDVFECTECKYRSNRMNSLQRHIYVVHSNELVYCDKCEFKCTKKDTLRAHRHRKHKDGTNNKIEAQMDNKKANAQNTQKTPVRNKTEETIKLTFSCIKCDFKSKKKTILRKHTKKEHQQERTRLSSMKCDECEYSCSKSKVLDMHKYRKHNGVCPPFDYECNLCSYKCSKGEMLTIHLFKKHNGAAPEPRSCSKCEYTTPWTSHMKNHMDKHIGKIRLFYCDKCDFRNKNKLVLRHHETLDHGIEATVLCNLCDFKTSSTGYLKAHITMKHSNNVFMCDQCSFKSTYVAALKNHTRIHDKQSWFQCESCSYQTPAKGNLKIHNESKHMGIRHPCQKCKFVGYNKAHLKLHTDAVHLDSAHVNKCDHCDYIAADNSLVKKHQQELHYNVKSETSIE